MFPDCAITAVSNSFAPSDTWEILSSLIPASPAPCESIASPSTTTSIAPVCMTSFVYFFPSADTRLPSPSISGTVPKLNISIASAPDMGLPEPSAIICMDCIGPHGMRPFNSPTTNGLFSVLFFWLIFMTDFRGNLIWSFLNAGKIPSILIPIITINNPAVIFNMPCSSSGIPLPEPPVRIIPAPPSTNPTAVYETTRPALYSTEGMMTFILDELVFSAFLEGIHCERWIPPHIAIQWTDVKSPTIKSMP